MTKRPKRFSVQKLGGVKRIDIGPKLLAQRAGEVGLRFDSRNLGEPLLERGETALLDAIGVHESRVVVGDQSLRRAGGRLAGARFADQIGVALLGFLKDLETDARAGTIGRYFGRSCASRHWHIRRSRRPVLRQGRARRDRLRSSLLTTAWAKRQKPASQTSAAQSIQGVASSCGQTGKDRF